MLLSLPLVSVFLLLCFCLVQNTSTVRSRTNRPHSVSTSPMLITSSTTIFPPMLTTMFTASVVPAVLVTPVLPLLSSTAATVVSLVTLSSCSRRPTRRFLLSWRPSLVRAVLVVAAVVALEDAVVVVLPFAMCAAWAAEVDVEAVATAVVAVAMEVLQEAGTVVVAAGEVLLLNSHMVVEAAATLAAVAATATHLGVLVAPLGGREPSRHSLANNGAFSFLTSWLVRLRVSSTWLRCLTMPRRRDARLCIRLVSTGLVFRTLERVSESNPCLSANTAFSVFFLTLYDSRASRKGYHYACLFFTAGRLAWWNEVRPRTASTSRKKSIRWRSETLTTFNGNLYPLLLFCI